MFFSKALQMDDTLGNFGSGINWNNVIDQGFALASQGFNSFGGQTVGTQFATNPNAGGIFAIRSRPAFDDSYKFRPTGNNQQNYGANDNPNQTPGKTIDDLFRWLLGNPIYPLIGGVALYLLFKEPPRRK